MRLHTKNIHAKLLMKFVLILYIPLVLFGMPPLVAHYRAPMLQSLSAASARMDAAVMRLPFSAVFSRLERRRPNLSAVDPEVEEIVWSSFASAIGLVMAVNLVYPPDRREEAPALEWSPLWDAP